MNRFGFQAYFDIFLRENAFILFLFIQKKYSKLPQQTGVFNSIKGEDMKIILPLVCIICFTPYLYSQNNSTVTDSLVKKFHSAWNSEDLPGMISLLDKNAFFKSPFQLRYGRDSLAKTVLITNPPVFKVVRQTEIHSYVREDLAWSIGNMVCDVYDENGNLEKDPWYNDYIYVFCRNNNKDWKLLMMIFHE